MVLSRTVKTYSAALFAMIFWSLSFVWFKVANVNYEPIAIVYLRLIISVIILTSYLLLTGTFMKIKKRDRKYFLMLAVFEPFLYFLGESFGLTYVSSTVGSVLISTIPVFATIGAWVLFKERLKIINYAGILLSFIGVLVFLLNSTGALTYNLKGIALLFLAVFSAVGYNLTLGKLVHTYSPVYIVNVQNVIGIVLFAPIFFIFNFDTFIHATHTFKSLTPIFELAIFASCGAFILFAYSVKKVGITKANAFDNIIPVFTALFAFLLLGDKLSVQNIIGIVIVIAGLFMSQINGRRKTIDEALILTGKTA
jgi:drug/metabolite transporter (DMT)-like permease